jgi:hypothetical protein
MDTDMSQPTQPEVLAKLRRALRATLNPLQLGRDIARQKQAIEARRLPWFLNGGQIG